MKALKRKEKGNGDKITPAEAKLIDRYNRLADKSERLNDKYIKLKGKEDRFDETKNTVYDHYPAGSKSKKFGDRAADVKKKLLGYKEEFNSIKDEAEAILTKVKGASYSQLERKLTRKAHTTYTPKGQFK
tara:strand:- start:113 stop:502 length:390 start_codon:yes stop_codon:yes gene_type:complete